MPTDEAFIRRLPMPTAIAIGLHKLNQPLPLAGYAMLKRAGGINPQEAGNKSKHGK